MKTSFPMKFLNLLCLMFFLTGCQSTQQVIRAKNPTVTTSMCDTQPLKIVSPLPNAQLSFPVNVEVVVDNTNTNCSHWTVFEAQAGTAEIKTLEGISVGSMPLTTKSDWMTEKPVTYTATIPLSEKTNDTQFTLVISSENPSGDPAKMLTRSVPIQVVQ